MSMSNTWAYLSSSEARDHYYNRSANPQDNLNHSIFIGLLSWINAATPIFLWLLWAGKGYRTPAIRAIWDRESFYKYGWWAFIIGYGIEWIVPALLWPLTWTNSKLIGAMHAAWLLFVCSMTWWLMNLGIAALWIVGAMKYQENTVFSKSEIWTLTGVFLGYAVPANIVYFWVFHKDAYHPETVDADGDTAEVSISATNPFDFDF